MKLELSDTQLQVIVEGLANLPWKTAHPVIAELDKQIKENQVTVEKDA